MEGVPVVWVCKVCKDVRIVSLLILLCVRTFFDCTLHLPTQHWSRGDSHLCVPCIQQQRDRFHCYVQPRHL